jgi:hypothetical protein
LGGAGAAAGERCLCFFVKITLLEVLVTTAMFNPVDLAAGMQNCCVGGSMHGCRRKSWPHATACTAYC